MEIKPIGIKKSGIKKPRVALLVENWFPTYSGEQVHTAKLATNLAADHGWEVEVLVCGDESKSAEERTLLKVPGISVKRLGKWKALYGLRAFFYLLHAGKNYTLTHAHCMQSAVAMKLASWFTKVPTVLTVHANQISHRNWTFSKIMQRVVFLETRYSQEISVSEAFLKSRNVNKHVLVIPNGIDPAPFDNTKVENDPACFTAIFVGRLDYDKGVDVLLDAVKRLVDSNEFIKTKRDFMLNIVGEGRDEEGFKKYSEKLGVSKYVKFHGKVGFNRLVELYKGADLFVLPSRHETLPLTLLEACAARLPILATNVGDTKNVVIEGTNGHLIPPGDTDELAYYLELFAMNPHLEQMGQNSYDLVTQEYAWSIALKKIVRVYENLQKVRRKVNLMPWQTLMPVLRNRKFKEYRGRKPLKFCFTVNVTQPYAPGQLPHETEHIQPFLERFSEFTANLEMPATIFVQEDLLDPFFEEFHAMQNSGHELGVFGEKKNLRTTKERLSALTLQDVRMFRSKEELADHDLKYVHEQGFETLPTSQDPAPHLDWKWGLPFGRIVKFDLKNLLEWDDELLLQSVNRLLSYQRENGIDPYLIFECNSWEFQSRDEAAYASGENFTKLARKLAVLRDKFEIEFQTLSDFCKSCIS
jgi:glycosyltransferase involved in cell wall biosynthesis